MHARRVDLRPADARDDGRRLQSRRRVAGHRRCGWTGGGRPLRHAHLCLGHSAVFGSGLQLAGLHRRARHRAIVLRRAALQARALLEEDERFQGRGRRRGRGGRQAARPRDAQLHVGAARLRLGALRRGGRGHHRERVPRAEPKAPAGLRGRGPRAQPRAPRARRLLPEARVPHAGAPGARRVEAAARGPPGPRGAAARVFDGPGGPQGRALRAGARAAQDAQGRRGSAGPGLRRARGPVRARGQHRGRARGFERLGPRVRDRVRRRRRGRLGHLRAEARGLGRAARGADDAGAQPGRGRGRGLRHVRRPGPRRRAEAQKGRPGAEGRGVRARQARRERGRVRGVLRGHVGPPLHGRGLRRGRGPDRGRDGDGPGGGRGARLGRAAGQVQGRGQGPGRRARAGQVPRRKVARDGPRPRSTSRAPHGRPGEGRARQARGRARAARGAGGLGGRARAHARGRADGSRFHPTGARAARGALQGGRQERRGGAEVAEVRAGGGGRQGRQARARAAEIQERGREPAPEGQRLLAGGRGPRAARAGVRVAAGEEGPVRVRDRMRGFTTWF
mmetsp:Transcript_10962/g.32721  ORF Transcript_10962/g.32721 Transcript_10962/m.32721 type:complete len:564 (+) Transcript_10962:461-2152(+)